MMQPGDAAWSGQSVQMKVCICPLPASPERVPIRFTSADAAEQVSDYLVAAN